MKVRAIVDKLPALDQPQEVEAVATNLCGDLEEQVQADGGRQDIPVVPGGGVSCSPYSVTKRTTDGGDLPGGATGKKGDEKKSAASSAQGGSKDAAAEQAEGVLGAGRAATKAGAAPARGKKSVYQPAPSTGMKRPGGAPAPNPVDEKRDQPGYGRSTLTDQAKHAYSTQQTKGKARRLTAELTGMHAKYKAALPKAPPEGIIRPAEAAERGPSKINCIRSTLGEQGVPKRRGRPRKPLYQCIFIVS